VISIVNAGKSVGKTRIIKKPTQPFNYLSRLIA
jgi:hypothetical protein